MKILISGAQGFVGQNLVVRLQELKKYELLCWDRTTTDAEVSEMIQKADFIFHLAGVNRPKEDHQFESGNTGLTEKLATELSRSKKKTPVVYTSSIQVEKNNPYGKSKLNAEKVLTDLGNENGNPVVICRLPNIFGKWSRPNYNSAVATFCYNVARGIPVSVNDPAAEIQLLYIDDLVSGFLKILEKNLDGITFEQFSPIYKTSVGYLSETIQNFKTSRDTLLTDKVGVGLTRALYSTYVSFLPFEEFSYKVQKHEDSRGMFVEMLKTKDSGQFSFFTAHPGITRGGHYHHSKTEKFLVIKGEALFGFRNILTGESKSISTSGAVPTIVETVPGWSHNIKNIGQEEMVVMLWANENFDRENPDTIGCEV